ncbi:hypothetical protein V5799_033195 [Amblyomma americanum]|uniref:Cathepsin L n=1 Tax=Amblyomma americanum TaxID=6943 RepID=A0AAQ4DP06_AMBAM
MLKTQRSDKVCRFELRTDLHCTMIRRRILLVLLASASMALQQEFLREEWESFKAKNGKKYTTGEEEERRKCIFEKNLELIIQHNKKYAEGNVTYKLAMNHFGDMVSMTFISIPGVMKQPGLMTLWWIVVFFTATAALLANAADMDELWISFKLKYNKTYASLLEDQQRKRAFVLNSWKIAKHNEKYARRQITYALAVNEFADMLPGEKKNENIYKSIYDPRKRFQDHELSSPPVNISELPVKFDWRDKGAVTPVRTQGTCLATWAFSAVGAVESHNYIKTGKLVELSEQNLIDCSQDFGNLGCEGGRVDQAFEYIIHNGGIELEQLYPFVEKTMPCTFDRGAVGAKISKYNTVSQGSEKQLQSVVATLGPVAVAVDASNDDFFQYDQGIYNNPLCSSTNVNYALLVVGYGTVDGKDYWICKNR